MARCTRLISRPFHGTTGEDRWAWRRGRSGWTTWVICDGASEGYDPAGWAQVLADHLAESMADGLPGHLAVSPAHPPADSKAAGLAELSVSPAVDLAERAVHRARRAYKNQALHKQGKVNRGLHDRTGSDRGSSGTGCLDWLSRASLARGSWSTALALRCSPTFSYIEVWAMGDTELFILDGFTEVHHLPLLRAEDFSASPTLIASSASAPDADPDGITAASHGPRNHGTPDTPGLSGYPEPSSVPSTPGAPGTSDRSPRWVCRKINLRPLRKPRLILVSDALASYILGHDPAESIELWQFLLTEKPERVYRWLGEEEGHFQLRPDDHTLIEVRP